MMGSKGWLGALQSPSADELAQRTRKRNVSVGTIAMERLSSLALRSRNEDQLPIGT